MATKKKIKTATAKKKDICAVKLGRKGGLATQKKRRAKKQRNLFNYD